MDQLDQKSLVMVLTGNGKGKTTAALGMALRAVGHGGQVVVVQFMKGRTYGELKAVKEMPHFQIIKGGRDVFVDKDNPAEIDLKMAQESFAKARDYVNSGRYKMVVLDEINVAVHYGLIQASDVLQLIEQRPEHVDLVLTGRYMPEEFFEIADLISEVKEVKHHYQKGIPARSGIEY